MRPGQDVRSPLDAMFSSEWLLSNGIGGSASGTAAGANARRTHALLTATRGHAEPITLLLRLDERVLSAVGTFELGSALVAGGKARPAGHRLIESFHAEPWPTWRYRAGETLIQKSVLMVDGHHAVAIAYRHIEGPPVRIAVSPLTAARSPHAVQRENPALRGAAKGVPGRVRIEFAEGDPALTLWHNGAFLPARVWHRRLHLPLDALPGVEPEYEDAFVPGHIEGGLGPGEELLVVASSESDLFRALAAEDRLGTPPPRSLAECVRVIEREREETLAGFEARTIAGADFTARLAAAAHGREAARRRAPLVEPGDPWVIPLAAALEAGLVQRAGRLGLAETLPDSHESGAAALRAVPALIALRAFDDARSILRGAAEYLSEGLAPEGFAPENGTPRYGDAATSLWLIGAADVYARRSDDLDFVRDVLYAPLESVMLFYRAGTHGIRVGTSGLLETGNGDRWSARADLNILWYHALVAMAQLARLTGRRENGAFYLAWARDHQTHFHDVMWDVRQGALYQSLGPDGPVSGLSPAQALAVSLSPTLIGPDRAACLIETLEEKLLTPYGLLDEPGGTIARPEWLGPFFSAYLRVYARDLAAQARVGGWLRALRTLAHGDAEAEAVANASVASGGRPLFSGVPASFRLAADGTWIANGARSPLAAAELLRLVIEELDRAEVPELAGVGAE
jgi:glycogen debranching enzyme